MGSFEISIGRPDIECSGCRTVPAKLDIPPAVRPFRSAIPKRGGRIHESGVHIRTPSHQASKHANEPEGRAADQRIRNLIERDMLGFFDRPER